MFVLSSKNDKFVNKHFKEICYFKNFDKTLNKYEATLNKKNELYSFNKKRHKNFKHFILEDKNRKTHKQEHSNMKIAYFFIFKMSYSNCMVHLIDCQGNIIYHINSGLLGFQGKQKSSRYAILAILQELTKYEQKLKPFDISLIFSGLIKKHSTTIINNMKTKFKIKLIKCYNMHPHNGCRPRKTRRLKNKKKINL